MKVRFSVPEKKAPDVREGVRIPYAPARRTFPRWRWYLVVLLVTSPLLFFLSKAVLGWMVASSPGVVAMEQVPLNSPRPAVVESVFFARGDAVEAGAVLLRLVDASVEVFRAPLEAERKALLLRSPRVPAAAAQRRGLALAEESVAYERQRLKAIEELYGKGAATRAEVDEASAGLQRARADLVRAEVDLEEVRRVVEDPDVAVRLAQIEAELEALSRTRGPLDLKSPLEGQLLEVAVAPGETVGQGTPLVRIADPSRVFLVTFVRARDMRFVGEGAEVRVRFPEGRVIPAAVAGSPLLAEPTPAPLAGPLSDGSPALKVRLLPLEPLPFNCLVEGLPVTVYWGLRPIWPWSSKEE